MSDGALIAIASVLSALIGAALLHVGTRRKIGLDDLQARYDQMQEDVNAERTARLAAEAGFRAEVTGLRLEMVGLRAEVRVRDDYIDALRLHINARREPPPPPFPMSLTGMGGA